MLGPFRVSLMILLLAALDVSFVLENPGNSSILIHPQLQWALQVLRRFSNETLLKWFVSCNCFLD